MKRREQQNCHLIINQANRIKITLSFSTYLVRSINFFIRYYA